MNRNSALFRCLRAGLLGCLVMALPLWAQTSVPSQDKPQSGRSDEARERDRNQNPQSDQAPATQEKHEHGAMTAQSYLDHTSRANASEISMARLAQQKASSQDVKDFARQIENDHNQAEGQLKQVAQKDKLQLPQSDQPPAKESREEKELSRLSGSEFDKAYIRHEIRDHRQAIAMTEKASKSLTDPDARQYAENMLHKQQEHLGKAQQIAQKLGVSTSMDMEKDHEMEKMPPK